MPVQPLWKAAAAVFPYSADLHQRYFREPKYKDQTSYSLARQEGQYLWVPREAVPGPLDRAVDGQRVNFTGHFQPRSEEQTRIAIECQQLLAQGRSFIVQAPTGWGKTYLGCHLAYYCQRRTLVITTKEDVIDQWQASAASVLGLDLDQIGFWAGDVKPKPEHQIVLGLVQSILKGPARYPNVDFSSFGLVIVDECFHPSHELLTLQGWKGVAEITTEDRVAQVDAETGEVSFVSPERVVQRQFSGDLVRFSNQRCDLLATPEHQHLVYWRGSARKLSYGDLVPTNRWRQRHAGYVAGQDSLSDQERFLIAYQADGTDMGYSPAKNHYRVRFSLSRIHRTVRKERKVFRLLSLLGSLGYQYSISVNSRGDTNVAVSLPYPVTKDLSWLPLDKSSTYYRQVLDEIVQWDGWVHEDGIKQYATCEQSCADRIQAVASLAGFVVTCAKYPKGKGHRDSYRVSWYGNLIRPTKSLIKTTVPYEGPVYCVTVPTGNVLTRRNGKVVVTGNCHRMGADEFSQSMWWLPARLRLGLSATPRRADGKTEVFLSHIGPVAVIARQETLIPKVMVQKTGYKIPMVRRQHEWVQLPHYKGRIMNVVTRMAADGPRNEIIVKFLIASVREGRRCIVFADTVDHLKLLQNRLISHGIKPRDIGFYVGTADHGVYHATSKKDMKTEREAAKQKHILLATYKMAAEATDIPWLDTCVLATPRSDVEQIVGRIRRLHPNKKTPVVLDLVDDDSTVLLQYANRRLKWYQSLGCSLIVLN